MSYMESAMQDKIDGDINLHNAICNDACDIYKQTGIMPLDMKMQRDELLEALKFAKKEIIELHNEAGEYEYVNYAIIDDAMANAEK